MAGTVAKAITPIAPMLADPEHQGDDPRRAAPAALDLVYRTLIAMCPLSDQHRDNLTNIRQLPADQLDLYGTLPARLLADKMNDLIVSFGSDLDLLTVPGFVMDAGRLVVAGQGLLVGITTWPAALWAARSKGSMADTCGSAAPSTTDPDQAHRPTSSTRPRR